MRSVRSLLLPCAAIVLVAVMAHAPAAHGKPGAAGRSGAAGVKRPSSDTSRVHVGPAGAGTEAFIVWPGGSGAAPAVIVAHEEWGLNGQIREVARRLAAGGYVAIVPDLYHGTVTAEPAKARELMRGLADDAALVDLEGAVTWLREQPSTAKSRIGVIGFGMGGRFAELLDLHSDQLSAAVMFYGPPEADPRKLAGLRAPLQGHFATEDEDIPAARVEALRAALVKAGKPADVYVYSGAGHAFMNEELPSFHADAARQAWARTLGFLQKHLKD